MKKDPVKVAQGQRLAEARNLAGYKSAREAALSNEWPESSYRAHEGGTRTIGQDDAERYARVYKARGVVITAERILFGDRAKGGPSRFIEVPLLSWVSAGRLRNVGDLPSEVPMIPFADLGAGKFFALKVVGDSMDRISPEGSIIVVNCEDRTPVAGRSYVFSVNGEATYKRWEPDPRRLESFSTNPANPTFFVRRLRDLEVIGRVRRTVLDL